MRQHMILVSAAGAALVVAGSAQAQTTYASQSFDLVANAPSITSNATLVGGVLTGTGRVYAGTGAHDLGFTTLWTQTRTPPSSDLGVPGPLDRDNGFPDSRDFTGVTGFGGSNSPNNYISSANPAAKGYEFNDGDGRISLQLTAATPLGVSSRSVSLYYWVTNTTWEVDDFFEVFVSDGTNTMTGLSLNAGAIAAVSSFDVSPAIWNFLSFPVPDTFGPNLTVSIEVDNNSGSENIFVDNVAFHGIPTPGTLALLGAGGLMSLRRRRR